MSLSSALGCCNTPPSPWPGDLEAWNEWPSCARLSRLSSEVSRRDDVCGRTYVHIHGTPAARDALSLVRTSRAGICGAIQPYYVMSISSVRLSVRMCRGWSSLGGRAARMCPGPRALFLLFKDLHVLSRIGGRLTVTERYIGPYSSGDSDIQPLRAQQRTATPITLVEGPHGNDTRAPHVRRRRHLRRPHTATAKISPTPLARPESPADILERTRFSRIQNTHA